MTFREIFEAANHAGRNYILSGKYRKAWNCLYFPYKMDDPEAKKLMESNETLMNLTLERLNSL